MIPNISRYGPHDDVEVLGVGSSGWQRTYRW
jgi:hypothetical protein